MSDNSYVRTLIRLGLPPSHLTIWESDDESNRRGELPTARDLGAGVIAEDELLANRSESELLKALDWRSDGDSLDSIFGEGWREDFDAALRGELPPQDLDRELGTIRAPAWYQSMHYFGDEWGIYIRQSYLRRAALDFGAFLAKHPTLGPAFLTLSRPQQERVAALGPFIHVFLHEQFHHKVESFGLKMLATSGLVSANQDHYTRYFQQVYNRTLGSPLGALEESLANADSYRRLNEERYASRLGPFAQGLQDYLKEEVFPRQGPGYRDASKFLDDAKFHEGLGRLFTLIRDGHEVLHDAEDWELFPGAIEALVPDQKQVVLVFPDSLRPLAPVRVTSPFSSRQVLDALKDHGWLVVPGGKGSHVKLKHPVLPGAAIVPPGREHVSDIVIKNLMEPLQVASPKEVRAVLRRR